MNHKYVAKEPDRQGYIRYSESENRAWNILYTRQYQLLKKYACKEYLLGLDELDLCVDVIPQLPVINKKLKLLTGWQLEPVSCLIPFDQFFNLLANKKFPAATFIRHVEELDFLSEPDIFHEIVGHCPLLLNKQYADFSKRFGELGRDASGKDQSYLARLYWFTIETGLIQSESGFKAYGGATLSSKSELQYAITSAKPLKLELDLIEALRTSYRYDTLPDVYYYLEHIDQLSDITEATIIHCVEQARHLGLYPDQATARCAQA